MTKRKTLKKNEPTTVVADDPDDQKGALMKIGGSKSDRWNNTLANQAVQALWVKNSDAEERDRQLSATVAALCQFASNREYDGGLTRPDAEALASLHLPNLAREAGIDDAAMNRVIDLAARRLDLLRKKGTS